VAVFMETTDFTVGRLVSAYNRDLANALGNLAPRVLTLSRRPAARRITATVAVGDELHQQAAALPAVVDHALARYDFRAACEAIIALAEAGNRFIEAETPWQLAKAADAGDTHAAQRFEAVLDTILAVCRVAADELTPLVPEGAARLAAQLNLNEANKHASAFPRITERASVQHR